MSQDRWPASWHELRSGKGCGMCANQGMEDGGWGVRFLQGACADAFLWRSGVVRGYAVAIWKHRHVAEPTELPADQAAGFWLETLRAGAAIERHLRPPKLNYLTLGNALPTCTPTSSPATPMTLPREARCRSTSSTPSGSPKTACRPTCWRYARSWLGGALAPAATGHRR